MSSFLTMTIIRQNNHTKSREKGKFLKHKAFCTILVKRWCYLFIYKAQISRPKTFVTLLRLLLSLKLFFVFVLKFFLEFCFLENLRLNHQITDRKIILQDTEIVAHGQRPSTTVPIICLVIPVFRSLFTGLLPQVAAQ